MNTEALDTIDEILKKHDDNRFAHGEIANRKFSIQAIESLLVERESNHVEIYKWLLGYYDFPESQPGKRYNWRTELRAKLPEHIKAQLNKEEKK